MNMPDNIQPPHDWWTKVLIALLGGTAKLAYESLTGRRHTIWHFILRGVVSLFIGVVCYHILPRDSEFGFAITGLLSWMGADGISILIEIVKANRKDK